MSKNTDAIALLEKHFDIAFAAPDGIKKLRELILSLAMQGKLVAQDPSDQPASELLKEIEAEKKRLAKEGKMKNIKPLPKITEEEKEFILPTGWEWSRLQDVLDVRDGTHDSPQDANGTETYPLVTSKNFVNGKIDFSSGRQISANDHFEIVKRSKVDKLDILFSMIGGNIGNQVIVEEERDFSIKNVALFKYYNNQLTYPYFIKRYLENLANGLQAKAAGGAQPFVSLGFLRNLVIALPPTEEQRRLVAKIDELMARCDELEKLRGDRDRKQITVHTAALNRLLIAKEQSDFNTAWQFITQHFSELYSVKENVAELRKAILQLAVMGKLVPQDPNDQPASELLKEIEKEKERLIKEGKIKKSKSLPEIKSEEIPYEIPASWQWVRFFTINVVKSELVSAKDYPLEKQIAPDSIEKGSGRLLYHRTVEESGAKGPNNRFYKNQILYSKIRPSLNKAVIAPYSGLCSADMYPIETFVDINFMLKSILSEMFLEQVRQAENRVKMPKLNLDSLGIFLIPLPPLAEQRRIVAKIDQLMALCDNLEKQIDTANSKQTNLLNAVMTKI
jgi:type I restriction enzyme S subunit